MLAVLNFKSHLSELFAQAVSVVAPEAAHIDILIERPKLLQFGDAVGKAAAQIPT